MSECRFRRKNKATIFCGIYSSLLTKKKFVEFSRDDFFRTRTGEIRPERGLTDGIIDEHHPDETDKEWHRS